MKNWQTNLILRHNDGKIQSDTISISCGIFQGDSFSPLAFCLALAPLSTLLKETGCGYEILKQKISHLFYMDDLKLYSKNDNQLEMLLKTLKSFSDDIKMTFGLEKCAKASFRKGKLFRESNLQLDQETSIKELGSDSTYRCLGVHEADGIRHEKIIKKEYLRRLRSVLNSELNSVNIFKAINSFAIPVVSYSFNIIKWTKQEIKQFDTKTRKLMTINKIHHPRADTERLYLSRRVDEV
ncbi:uncharacterized protein LOC144422860 [Styela clava]